MGLDDMLKDEDMMEDFRKMIGEMRDAVSDMRDALVGTVSPPNPGLISRVVNLESEAERREEDLREHKRNLLRAAYTSIAAAITAAAAAVWGMLTGKNAA